MKNDGDSWYGAAAIVGVSLFIALVAAVPGFLTLVWFIQMVKQ